MSPQWRGSWREPGTAWARRGYWAMPGSAALQVNIEDAAGSGFSAAATMVAEQLSAAGFDASVSAPPEAAWRRDIVDGDFDATVLAGASGPSPFYMYENWLDPSLVVDGRTTSGDHERLTAQTMPTVAAQATADLAAFTDSLSDSPGAAAAVKALGAIVADQLPVVPLMYSLAWGELSTRHTTGWPNGPGSYEPPVPWAPFAEYTVLQLSAPTST